MASVLFVTWDGGGNLPPALAIARELQRRGHRVRMLGHAVQRTTVEAAGVDFAPFAGAHAWDARRSRSRVRADLAYARVFTDRAIGADVVASFRAEPADRVVVDGMLLGALDGLHRAGIPSTILVHTLRSAMHDVLMRGPLGAIARLRGLHPEALYAEAEAEVVVSDPLLDIDDSPGPTVHRTGVVLPAIAQTAAPTAVPLVLVSFSTTFIRGQRGMLQRAADALSLLRVRTVVATGPTIHPGGIGAGAGTEVRAHVPHADVMPEASLVIGHGGHGTTTLALAHGIPMLVMPASDSFDQPRIARVVQSLGAGRALSRHASPEAIRLAARDLLADPAYRENAARVGASLRARNGLRGAVELLER